MNIWYKNFLSKEIKKWKEKGIIDLSTAHKIAGIYDIDIDKEEKKSFILQLVAYLFIALALFTFIGANWEDIPRFIRLIITLCVTLGVNVAGFYFLKKGKDKIAIGLFFLGNFCYGAGIALIAQIYHLGEHMPNGILLWAVGSMVLSLCVYNPILVAQSLLISLGWFMEEQIEYGHMAYSFILFILISCWVLWRKPSKFLALVLYIIVFLYLISLGKLFIDYGEEMRMEYIPLVSLAYSLFGISISHFFSSMERREIGVYFRDFSFLLGSFFLLILLFYENIYPYEGDGLFAFYQNSYLGVLSGVFLMLSLLISFYKKHFLEIIAAFILLILPVFLEAFEISPRIIFSGLNILVGGILIKLNRVKLGLCIIFLIAIVRYLDLIEDYVGASLLFLVFAGIILVINFKNKNK